MAFGFAHATDCNGQRALRDGDVFEFRWSDEWRQKSGRADLNWAFEGTLIYRDGVAFDTYWGLERSWDCGQCFRLEEWKTRGTLAFRFNLNDVVTLHAADRFYYADTDVFHITTQHACSERCVFWFLRKGATKDRLKIESEIHRRISKESEDAQRAVRFAASTIGWLNRQLEKLERGDIEGVRL